MGSSVRVGPEPLDPAAELAALTVAAEGAGAISSFVGIARKQSKASEPLDRLVLENHPRLTARSVEQIVGDAIARFDIDEVRVVHRHGAIEPGEAIVFAGAASAHRRAAIEAVDYLMDRLKTEAVFWKREEGPAGVRWIEPTEADYAERGRWE